MSASNISAKNQNKTIYPLNHSILRRGLPGTDAVGLPPPPPKTELYNLNQATPAPHPTICDTNGLSHTDNEVTSLAQKFIT